MENTSIQRSSDSSDVRRLSPLQVRALNVALASLWAALFFTVFITSVDQNAFMPSRGLRYVVQAFSPQGWAFFTRNPREAWHRTYAIDEQQGLHAADVADYRGAPWGGIDRSRRNRGIMTEQVIGQVPKDAWQPCKDTLQTCLLEYQGPVVEAKLTANDTTGLCGRFLIQEARTVPWAWRTSYHQVSLPSRIVLANVHCTDAKGQRQ